MGDILRAHPARGESHIQRNANREVATTSPPFYNDPYRSHVLFAKVASGTTFTCWPQHHFFAIGKPDQQVRKASHCGSKLQWWTHAMVNSNIACLCHIFLWLLFFAHIPFVVNRTFIATPTERLQQKELKPPLGTNRVFSGLTLVTVKTFWQTATISWEYRDGHEFWWCFCRQVPLYFERPALKKFETIWILQSNTEHKERQTKYH